MNSLVSIIVPIYNVEQYLHRCLDSLINQTYRYIEIIAVDDGSTDGSGNIARQFTKYPNFKYIFQPNGGLSAARNTGLKNCCGRFICFVDSDDYLANDAIRIMVENITDSNADFCCFNFSFVSSKNKNHIKSYTPSVLSLRGEKDILEAYIVKSEIKTTAWSKFYSHQFLSENNLSFKEGIINEDLLFTSQCCLKARKVSYIGDTLYFAEQRANSISRSLKPQNLTDYFIIYDSLKTSLSKASAFTHDLFDALIIKQIVYTLMLAAYRIDDFNKYKQFYSLLEGSIYFNKPVTAHLSLIGRKYAFLYRLSLRPRTFYFIVKSLRKFGFFMP